MPDSVLELQLLKAKHASRFFGFIALKLCCSLDSSKYLFGNRRFCTNLFFLRRWGKSGIESALSVKNCVLVLFIFIKWFSSGQIHFIPSYLQGPQPFKLFKAFPLMTLRRTDSPQGLGVLSVFILKSHTHFDPKLSLSSAFN